MQNSGSRIRSFAGNGRYRPGSVCEVRSQLCRQPSDQPVCSILRYSTRGRGDNRPVVRPRRANFVFALRIVFFYFYRRPPFRLLVVSLNSSQHRYKDELIETAKYIAAPGKGILASDESSGLFFVLISELDLRRAALSLIRIHPNTENALILCPEHIENMHCHYCC